jgi:hypothetical protein
MAVRKRYGVAGLSVLLLGLVVAWLLRPLPAAGPWRAQLLDADTREPLEGVIVLALWEKRTFAWPHPDRNYHDLDEVVSDRDGRFVIPARVVASRHPFEVTIGPRLTIFKPGYGRWHFEGMPALWATDRDAAIKQSEVNRERFAHGGVVMMMPRAKTRQERKEVLDRVRPEPEVPPEKYPRLLAAYNQERVSLGLPR